MSFLIWPISSLLIEPVWFDLPIERLPGLRELVSAAIAVAPRLVTLIAGIILIFIAALAVIVMFVEYYSIDASD